MKITPHITLTSQGLLLKEEGFSSDTGFYELVWDDTVMDFSATAYCRPGSDVVEISLRNPDGSREVESHLKNKLEGDTWLLIPASSQEGHYVLYALNNIEPYN